VSCELKSSYNDLLSLDYLFSGFSNYLEGYFFGGEFAGPPLKTDFYISAIIRELYDFSIV